MMFFAPVAHGFQDMIRLVNYNIWTLKTSDQIQIYNFFLISFIYIKTYIVRADHYDTTQLVIDYIILGTMQLV